MARLLTTLTMASRLTLAPLTWTWPCSIEMLVEVGARAREEGLRGSLPRSPFFCPQVGAAADRAGASSPKVAGPGSTYPDSPNSPGHDPALLFLPPTPSLPRVPRASLKTPTALTSPGHCRVFLLTFPPPGADSDSDSDLSLEEERSLSIPHAPEDTCTNHTHHRATPRLTCAVLLPTSTLPPNREGDTYSRAGSGPSPSWGSKACLSAYGVGNILGCSVQKERVSQMDGQWVGGWGDGWRGGWVDGWMEG